MESTVVKIEFDCKKLLIFRKGAISLNELKDFQIKNLKDWDVEYKSKTTIEGENQDCPGQFIKHYSPNIPTYIVSKQISFTKNDVSVIKTDFLSNYSLNIKALNIENLNVIILDINGHLKNLLKDVDLKIVKYYDMTSDSVEKSKEALNNIYYYLRLTESSKANCVLLPFLDEILGDENNDKPTLFDRILKASSSMIIRFE